jgi:hypothetical protein
MEMLYYTVAAIFLYAVSDWILNRIEISRGKRFENRTLVFFAIILVLSVILFNLIQQLRAPPGTVAPAYDEPAHQELGDTPQ